MRGVHYTPAAVVRYMVDAALGRFLERGGAGGRAAAPRVLDPACGEGAFLLGAFDWLLAWHRARTRGAEAGGGGPDPPGLGRRVAACLHGVDLDAAALRRAAAALRDRVAAVDGDAPPAGGADLRRGDTLRAAPAACFDVVLGNPPYVFGEHLGAAEKRAYRRYELGRGGQLDLYKLFFERSLRDLLVPGGVHAFVVPDALLARDEHADLRGFIARRAAVVRLCHVGRVFPRAAVSALVVVSERAAAGGRCAVDRWARDVAVPSHEVPAAGLGAGPWIIHAPAAWTDEDGPGARLALAGTLGALLAPGTRGLTRGEERGKGALGDCPRPGRAAPRHLPVYAGADVQRLRAAPPRRQLARAAVAKDPAHYRGPKLLVVKTGAGPVAAAVADDLPALQSVYVLHPARPLDLDGVAAVVCSALVTAHAYYRWTAGKGLQPQLTLANVRALPFPAATAAALGSLGAQVRALRRDLARPGGAARAAARERALDEEVARLFGLDLAACLPALRPALDALPASQRPRWWPPRP